MCPQLARRLAALPPPESSTQSEEASRFWSEAGWLDISGLFDQAGGFVPLFVPITEPAVGLGSAGALLFIDKQITTHERLS